MKIESEKEFDIKVIQEIYNGNSQILGELYSKYRDYVIKGIQVRYPKVPKDIVIDIYTDACIVVKDNIIREYIRFNNHTIVNKKGISVSLKGYIFTIVRNKVEDYRKSMAVTKDNGTIDDEKQKSRKPLFVSIDSLMRIFIGSYYDESGLLVDDEYMEDNRLGIIRRELSQLTKVCRDIFEAFYCDELSMTEIAEKLGYNNADTAKNQKGRCFRKFKTHVESFAKKH